MGYRVKFGGKWIDSDSLPSVKENIPNVKEEVKQAVVEEVQATAFAYKKADISRMNVATLRELAKKEGIADAESMTGADIKRYLIEKYSL